MTRMYQKKYLENGEPNPKYKIDSRKGDRHKRKGDRHNTNGNRHLKHERPFIALDTEGMNTDELRGVAVEEWAEYDLNRKPALSLVKHDISVFDHISLIAVSSEGDELINSDGITTEQYFVWLTELGLKYRRKHPIFVMYGGSYDMNMFLSDLPRDVLTTIWKNKDMPVRDRDRDGNTPKAVEVELSGRTYSIEYRPRKSFTLKRVSLENNGYKKNNVTRAYDASITVWDVIGFFQGKFVDVLADKKTGYLKEYLQTREPDETEYLVFPDGREIDMSSMRQMKKLRGTFTTDQLSEIAQYTKDECYCLVQLMNTLRKYLKELDLNLSRFDGAGAIAGALLQKYQFDKAIDDKEQLRTYPDLKAAQLHAYFGGNIQLLQFGTYREKIYSYDVISSYPSAMPDIPCITGGLWRKVTGMSNKKYSLMHVVWNFEPGQPIYPFPWRSRQGEIFYPGSGSGWYHRPEVDAALVALEKGQLRGNMTIVDSWEFVPYSDEKPLAFVADLFELRKRWKAEENAAEKVAKLGYNSLYGRTAQSVGWYNDEVNGEQVLHTPKYHNIYLAGLITSHTRARVFSAAIQSPENIIFIATDGIVSKVPLDLDVSTTGELGKWEQKERAGIIALQSGVYWILQDDGSSKAYYRGYDAGTLTTDFIHNAWKELNTIITTTPKQMLQFALPYKRVIRVPSERFRTLGSAIAGNDQWNWWRCWKRSYRMIDLLPSGKRLYVVNGNEPVNAHERMFQTMAFQPQEALTTISHKFKVGWERDEREYTDSDGVPTLIAELEHFDSEV